MDSSSLATNWPLLEGEKFQKFRDVHTTPFSLCPVLHVKHPSVRPPTRCFREPQSEDLDRILVELL